MKPTAALSLDQSKKKKMTESERETLIIDLLPKVKFIAARLAMKLPPHIELDDLIGYGVTGLIDAIDKFDAEKNVKFSTYAEFRIRGAMLDYLRAIDWCPRSVRQKANNLQSVFKDLEAVLGRPPTEEEVASEMGMSVDDVRKELSLVAGVSIFSLDEVNDDPESMFTQRKFLANFLMEKKMDEDSLRDLQEVVSKAIEDLPDNEKLLISLYYYDELTMREIGAILSLTESRVCQIHNQAILRMKGKVSAALQG